MNEREFIRIAVLRDSYWNLHKDRKFNKGTNGEHSKKLEKKCQEVLGEDGKRFYTETEKKYHELIKHFYDIAKSDCRRAGFGGWNEYVPSDKDKIKEYKQGLEKRNKLEEFNDKCKVGLFKFVDWYLDEKKKCCYCGVPESELSKYFNGSTQTEKACNRDRGPWLEVERLYTSPENKNIYNEDNCALACYICNNAKSDFISAEDFKPIAQAIHLFWKNKGVEHLEDFESNWKELKEKLEKLK